MKNNSLNTEEFNSQLCQFLDESPTPFHATQNLTHLFSLAGFTHLYEADDWTQIKSGRYIVSRNDSSLIAFNLPESFNLEHRSIQDFLSQNGIRMSGAHTDSPCLKLKPNAQINKNSYLQLGVEVYGGALLNPWFDRDLSLAGRVHYESTAGTIDNILIDFEKAIAVIPSLAIHLDRQANKDKTINSQTDILPVILQSSGLQNTNLEKNDLNKSEPETENKEEKVFDLNQILIDQINKQYPQLKVKKILSSELSLYDTQKSALTGLNDDFINSARLDNLLSCFIGAKALIDGNNNQACLLVCNDHEEVGSQSSSGAQGNFLISVLQRLCQTSENLARCASRSLFISADNAHGIHPNYSDKHDSQHTPLLNHGPVIKTNANQRYASNSETIALLKQIAQVLEIPVQDFVARTDMGCGSTIGPIIASTLGIRTIDIGIATFAMHSIREMSGSHDPIMLYQLIMYYNSK